jgi:hypothetical protein
MRTAELRLDIGAGFILEVLAAANLTEIVTLMYKSG